MGEDPVPGRLAALDQELAALDNRLDRHARLVMRGDVTMAVVVLALIAVQLIARPPVDSWELIAALATVALLAAGSFLQGSMLRSYRAEIRDLRARAGTSGEGRT